MRKLILIAGFMMGMLGALSASRAQNSGSHLKAPHVEVRLLGSRNAVVSGEEFRLGLSFKMEPHWHIYWKNPGDSGAAPKAEFRVSGARLEALEWPVPRRIPFGDFTNLGYEDFVILPVRGVVEDGVSSVDLDLKLEWLICREECIPGFGSLSLRIPVEGASVPSPHETEIRRFVEKVPRRLSVSEFAGGEDLRFQTLGPELAEISWKTPDGFSEGDLETWTVFPVDGERFSPSAPLASWDGERARYRIKIQEEVNRPAETLFVVAPGEGPAVEVDFEKAAASAGGGEGLWVLLLSAVLGGMILNLMPCVFPVLSIKVFSFLKAHENDKAALAKDGLLYTLGTLIAFTALGLAFLLIRRSGEAVGWGFQLQSPVVVFALAALFFILALNFLGVFEIGTFAMNWAGLRVNEKGWASAFGTGALSVLIAAPCTGPFMGAALGASTLLPAFSALMIFLALGFGLALPLLLLCLFPSWLSKLPRPGAWMNTLKEFFAFPLFATVIWLLWVLTQQTGADGMLWAGLSLLAVAMAFWIARRGSRWPATVLFLAGLVLPAARIHGINDLASSGASSSAWRTYDAGEIARARTQGRAVFIDFTAAWCITCQWNKKSVLETSAIQELFARQKVLLIRADWTKYDEKITEALAKFGRASVPLYVYYSPQGGEAKVLPQILTPSLIEGLF